MKLKLLAGLTAVGLLLSGCSSDGEKEYSKKLDKGFNVEHVHGVAYSKDDFIYMATHKGMIVTKDREKKWSFVGKDDFDLMGFHMQSDGTMLTSGHPGPTSDLPNPLGVLESKDDGGNWKTKALGGKVDFHILTSNIKNPNIVYGVIQMGNGDYKAGIYKSKDKGKSWERVKGTGFVNDFHGVYSLLSFPNNENGLLAGTNTGVYRSEDGGATWKIVDEKRLITALSVIPGSNDLISYSITEREAGMMISKNNGAVWEKIGLDLNKDAVAYFAIQPKKTEKIVAVTFENNLLLSVDGGQNWETLMEKGKLKTE
ncbi:F510_1955 family glycosylhydrolase [Niallia sp. 03190]|uniref:F510_1955 family glycosylhydrolase n=1 Tax=Niallia sp. 03190 TaxID=3458061 RepID=UPI0040447AA1